MNSPYRKWRDRLDLLPTKSLCIDIEFFCLLIAEMAEETIERYITESQPSLVKDEDYELPLY